jgi:P27 family predicted phage terminase small subunit
MPGPAPQPSELKKRRGNPGKRPLNTREPKPLVGLPSCPESLSPNAKRIWATLGPTLVRNGVMTETDGLAFAGVCVTEALFLRIAPVVDDMPLVQGSVTVDGSGQEHREWKTEPHFKAILEILKERRSQHAQFGMTPASRSKIVSALENQDDPIEAALSGATH